jgi:hypothetical protein
MPEMNMCQAECIDFFNEEPISWVNIGTTNGTEEKGKVYPVKEAALQKLVFSCFSIDEKNKKREALFISAIQNLLKKINFLELFQQLQNNQISEKNFEKEISSKAKKYVVQIDKKLLPDSLDYQIILNIINHIGNDIRELSTTEVGEMFSFDMNEITPHMLYSNKGSNSVKTHKNRRLS